MNGRHDEDTHLVRGAAAAMHAYRTGEWGQVRYADDLTFGVDARGDSLEATVPPCRACSTIDNTIEMVTRNGRRVPLCSKCRAKIHVYRRGVTDDVVACQP